MLMEYNGAVILISHDRHLIEATADRLWLVRNGAVKPALVERLGQRLREAVTFEMELARALRQDVSDDELETRARKRIQKNEAAIAR